MYKDKKVFWENMRAIGKYRYIFFMGGVWAGLVIILTTLIELWPNGLFISFSSFLIKAVVYYLFGGYIFGLVMWMYGEYTYKKWIAKYGNNA
jgi:hypothetical protein